MAISDSFDVASVEEEAEAEVGRPTITSIMLSSSPSLQQDPDMVTTSESESEATARRPHEAAAGAVSSEAAEASISGDETWTAPTAQSNQLVTSSPPPVEGEGVQPELRAVVVMEQGYHLYRPPSATGALSWIHSEGSLATSATRGTDVAQRYHDRNNSELVVDPVNIEESRTQQQQSAANVDSDAFLLAENHEEEKEEITDTFEFFNQSTTETAAARPTDAHLDPLAGMPTYAVGTYAALPEQATVLGGSSLAGAASDDESELAALKRAAAFGGGANQKPKPRPTEDWDRFFARTCEFWNALAMDAQANRNAAGDGTIHIERLMEDSLRLARQHYTQMTMAAHPGLVATVVEITDEYVHPSDLLSQDAVRAEFLGQDYLGLHHRPHDPSGTMHTTNSTPSTIPGANTVGAPAAAAHNVSEADFPTAEAYGSHFFGHTTTDHHHRHHATPATAQHVSGTTTAVATQVLDSFFEQAAEATVIDSAPVSKAESQIVWQNTEEAQVLQDSSAIAPEDDSMMDRKPPAVDTGIRQLSAVRGDSFAVAEQVGDVLSIEENLHPAEFVDTRDAEAELVGTDFLYAADVESAVAAPADAAFLSAEQLVTPSPTTGEAIRMTPEPPRVHTTSAAEVIFSTMSHSESGNDEVRAVLVDDTSARASTGSDVPMAASVVTPFQDRVQSNSSDQSAVKFLFNEERVGVSQVELESSETSAYQTPPTSDVASGTHAHESASPVYPVHNTTGTPGDSSCIPEWQHESPAREVAGRQVSEQSFGSQRSQLQLVSERASQMTAHLARSTGNVMESLFGDTRPPLVCGRRGRVNTGDVAQSVFQRTLLPWSVIHNASNQTWVATLQTNQKALDGKNVKEASKSLRAFSLPSEQQAVCLAKSWTPPRMQLFQENPSCHICKTKFAMFRRPCHCRNCGVCICKDCAVQWPAKMIPETYNIKKENLVNACKSCEWLCNTFRLALLEGKMDEAVAVHATGNVNLTMPFANVKGEEFFPVHCAVLGGNPQILRWLVDEHCCPIKSVRVSGKAARDLCNRYTPIVTSKGRSLLGIAMENESVEIVRYLVVNKGLSIAGEKDITTGMLIKNLDKVLRVMPDAVSPSGASYGSNLPESPDYVEESYYIPPPPTAPTFSCNPEPYPANDDFPDSAFGTSRSDWVTDEADGESDEDECRICFDGKIDCVATPCGHQMCCLNCSSNISRCPVCAQDCSFLRVFKP